MCLVKLAKIASATSRIIDHLGSGKVVVQLQPIAVDCNYIAADSYLLCSVFGRPSTVVACAALLVRRVCVCVCSCSLCYIMADAQVITKTIMFRKIVCGRQTERSIDWHCC